MRGLVILLLFESAGLALHAVGVPLPAAVLGLILFAGALFTKWARPAAVEPAGDFLLRNLLLFFIPPIAGMLQYKDLLAAQWFPIAVGLIASTVTSAVVAGYTVGLLERRKVDHDRG